jgi:hypothetical protein
MPSLDELTQIAWSRTELGSERVMVTVSYLKAVGPALWMLIVPSASSPDTMFLMLYGWPLVSVTLSVGWMLPAEKLWVAFAEPTNPPKVAMLPAAPTARTAASESSAFL